MFHLKKIQNITVAFIYFAYLKGANKIVTLLSGVHGIVGIFFVVLITLIGSYILTRY